MENDVDNVLELLDRAEGLELRRLKPSATLLVWTWNSLYRLVVGTESDVLVQGGSLFPELTLAHVDGASTGGRLLKTGWIGVGLLLEFRVGVRRFITSPVIAIAIEELGRPIVNEPSRRWRQ
jgi:hypothetical protein